jgi:hypothetical protein
LGEYGDISVDCIMNANTRGACLVERTDNLELVTLSDRVRSMTEATDLLSKCIEFDDVRLRTLNGLCTAHAHISHL